MRPVLLLLLLTIVSSGQTTLNREPLQLSIATSNSSYALGEVVQIRYVVRNTTAKVIELDGDSKNWAVVQVAPRGGEFRRYDPESFDFSVDGVNVGTLIGPNKSIAFEKEILWNYVPDVSRLSAEASRSYTDGKIMTNLKFPRAESYSVRVLAHVEQNGVIPDFASSPVEIDVTEPSRRDAEVWMMIEDDNDIAYVMQYRRLPRRIEYKADERALYRSILLGMLISNPDTIYSNRIKEALECSKPPEQATSTPLSLRTTPQLCS